MAENVKRALVIGGAGGLGLAIAECLAARGDNVKIYDRAEPAKLPDGCEYVRFNLLSDSIDALDEDIDILIYAAGFGRIAEFQYLTDYEISNGFRVNAECPALIIRIYMPRLISGDFCAAFICSVAGYLPSPMFAAYGAQKAAMRSLIESVNAELAYRGAKNRVTLVIPGYIKNTGFYGGITDTASLAPLARSIIEKADAKETEYFPDENYISIIDRANSDREKFARESMEYKLNSGRVSDTPSGIKGFLSGTFDLFHIGHLNLLRRAKQMCDYLTVGVHPEGSSHKSKPIYIPLEERMEILRRVKYVDRVVITADEDDEMYFREKFDMLFVGSDYRGTERFNRYERELIPLGVKIIYFPYTTGTSSTQLRSAITGGNDDKNS